MTEFHLIDKKGNRFGAKMHLQVVLPATPESRDAMKELLNKADADVSRLSSNDSAVSTLGIVLQLTKAIMDRISEVRNKCFRPIVSRLI